MEKDNGLMVTKLNDTSYLRVLENCIRLGWPMLIEDLGETLEATLAPVLLKQMFLQVMFFYLHQNDVFFFFFSYSLSMSVVWCCKDSNLTQ